MRSAVRYMLKWTAVFWLASVLIFTVVRLMPVSPVQQYLFSYNLPQTEENMEIVSRQMGLDRPLTEQYLQWMHHFLQGDWGESLVSHLDIREQFMQKLPYSVSIGLGGILLAGILSFILGYRAALKKGGICDRITAALAVTAQSVPSFITAILVINLFSVKLRLVRFFTGNGAYALISAILITALYQTGALSRVVRNAFREEMGKTYLNALVLRGFPREKALLYHAYRPALCRLISAVIANFAWVFGGSAVLEFAFAIPGISYFLVDSMQGRDYNVLQTYMLILLLWMFVVHLILNLALQVLDVRRQRA